MFRSISILFLLLVIPQSLFAEELSIGGVKNFFRLPLTALHQGFFEDEGLEVSHEVIAVGKLAMDAVQAGTIDIGMVVDSNLAYASFQATDLKVIATVMRLSTDGIMTCGHNREVTAEAIQGRRVGYLPATTSHIMLTRWLARNNLTMKDIVPVILQPAAMGQALRSGAVDYVSIWNPWRSRIPSLMDVPCTEVRNNADLYPTHVYLAVRQETLVAKRDALRRFLQALLAAEAFERAHETRAKEDFAKLVHFDGASLESVWAQSRARVELTGDALRSVDDTVEWLSRNDFRGKDLKVKEASHYMEPDILRSLAPQRVEITP